jgi:hypothetical protein
MFKKTNSPAPSTLCHSRLDRESNNRNTQSPGTSKQNNGEKGSATISIVGLLIGFFTVLLLVLSFVKYTGLTQRVQNAADLSAIGAVYALKHHSATPCEVSNEVSIKFGFKDSTCEQLDNGKYRATIKHSTPLGTITKTAVADIEKCKSKTLN